MIHKKLLEFQKLNITIEKDNENPHFRNSYSSLNEVMGKVKAPLNKLGVVIEFIPMATGVQTELVDTEDDSKVVGFFPYSDLTNAQKIGGSITYGKRYSVIAMLGLEDSDDDGESAVSGKPAVSVARAVINKSDKSFEI
jgi:hypothetical protein